MNVKYRGEKVEQLLKKSKRCSVYCITDDSGEKRIKRVINGGNIGVYELLRENPHRFMPKIFSVSEDENDVIVIEEFVDGDIISEACFSENQMLKASKELCAVLIHIHSLGIIHRDIKPSNILMTPSGHICLIDFEAARRIKPQADSDTRYLGTAGFAPPEQYGFSQTDVRSDIYALGKTFECIFGSLSYKRKYRKIIDKCTRLDPDDRYSDAAEILKALNGNRSAAAVICGAVGAAVIISASVWAVGANKDIEAMTADGEAVQSYSETVSKLPVTTTETFSESNEDIKETSIVSETTPSEASVTTTVQSSETVTGSQTTESSVTVTAAETVTSAPVVSEISSAENTDPFENYKGFYKNLDVNKAQCITAEEMAEPLLFKADDDIPMDYIIIDTESLKENKYVSMLCDYNDDGYDDLFQLSAYNAEGQNEYFRSLCVSVVNMYYNYPDFHIISDNNYFKFLVSTATMDQETGMIYDGKYVQLSVLDVNSDGHKDIVLSMGSVGSTINTQVFYYNNTDLEYSSSGMLNLYLYTSKQITCRGSDKYYVPDGKVYSLTLEDTLATFKYISPNVWDYEKYDDPLYQNFMEIAS